MISTKTGQEVIDLDEVIEITDEDFPQSGLKSASVIRVSRLAVISATISIGTIGEISPARLINVKRNLARWIED